MRPLSFLVYRITYQEHHVQWLGGGGRLAPTYVGIRVSDMGNVPIDTWGGAGGVAVSPSHRDREGHGFESHWSPQKNYRTGIGFPP